MNSRIAALVRRHPVPAFFAWFFTVGQALAFTPVIAQTRGVPLPVQPFICASTVLGLLLPALVITRVVDGPAGLRRLWADVVRVGVAPRWYALALLAIPLLAVGFTVAVDGAPTDTSVAALLSALGPGFVMALVLTFLPNNLWEEVAWAGFVQARLQTRWGAIGAAAICAPLFSLQHISLVVQGPPIEGAIVLGLLAVLAVPFRFLTGWVYNRTSSLFVVGLLHAAGNAVAGGSGFGAGLLPRLYPQSPLAPAAHLLVIAALGLLAVTLTRGRLGVLRAASAHKEGALTHAGPTS
jgi:uncharacterized protein